MSQPTKGALRQRRYYKRHRERIRRKRRKYYHENKDRINARKRELYRLRKERRSAWGSLVHKEEAKKDGRKPEDFRFDHLKVSNVEIVPDTKFGIKYLCRMPSDTPVLNQYDNEGNKIPDPVGMTLAWVHFKLVDSATVAKLDSHQSVPVNGLVTGYPPLKGGALWSTLAKQTSVKVVLEATPVFFFLSEDGSAMLNYFLTPDGYAKGKTVKSKVYNLSMNENGEVTLTPHYT